MKKITFLLFAFVAFCWQANAQFTESFETDIPATWTVINNGSTPGWVYNGAPAGGAEDGTGVASISFGSIAHDDYLITPGIAVTAGVNDRLSLYIKSRSATFLEAYEILLSTTDATAGAFTEELQASSEAPNAWTPLSFDLSGYVGSTVYVAVRATGTDEFALYVDNVVSDTPPSCFQPTALTANTISTTDVDITWTAGAGETAWNYEYGPAGFTMGTGGTTGSTTVPSLTLSGLTAGDYDIYVQSDCGSGDLSLWTDAISWTQPSNVGDICSLPLIATLEADCSTATANTIDYAVASADLSSVTCSTATSNGAWYEITTSDSGAIRLYTTGDVSGMAVFSDCGTELYCNSTLVPDFSLSGFAPNTAYLVAVWKDAATTGTSTVCFEDIACLFVTDFTVTSVTQTSMEIGWTENGTATAWDVEYGITGFTPTGTPTLDDVSNPYSVTNLLAATTYDFYVRADCGMNNTDVSVYNGPFIVTTLSAPPANDDCSGATPLTVDADLSCSNPVAGTTIGSTQSLPGCLGTANDDVWYSFVATGTTHVITIANTAGSSDIVTEVFDGCGGNSLMCQDTPNSPLTVTGLTAGNTYYFRIYTWSSTASLTTSFTVCVGTPEPAPANDECVDAEVINCGDMVSGSTVSATNSGNNTSNDVWYVLAGTAVDQEITASLCGSDFDTYIRIFDACAGTQVAFNDDNSAACGTGGNSEVTFTSDGVTTYYIMVEGYSTNNGNFDLAITCSTIGIQDYNASELFTYYPNPVNNTLSLRGVKAIQNVAVYNMLGQEVLRSAPNTVDSDLDMSSLNAGTYFVRVTVENATKTIKIIKK
ncbi:T9SS-dependent choice-of-anchor J family protein [Bizionia arctica]|uniref:Fibronectin type-III domain-containing protein n=1 Tax=Bizionia arctica TaxID=1495645 RepID=A0A917GFH9_9FLAO|nr:choice-of-anchor J domain-containing protein [Bizionia arctica]GGG43005.1 hypothetical protein GCM10010976_13100 [Bizionia arctica]